MISPGHTHLVLNINSPSELPATFFTSTSSSTGPLFFSIHQLVIIYIVESTNNVGRSRSHNHSSSAATKKAAYNAPQLFMLNDAAHQNLRAKTFQPAFGDK